MVQRDDVHGLKTAESRVEGDDSSSRCDAHHDQAEIGPWDLEDIGSLQIARAHGSGVHSLGDDHGQSFDVGLVSTERAGQQTDSESTHDVQKEGGPSVVLESFVCVAKGYECQQDDCHRVEGAEQDIRRLAREQGEVVNGKGCVRVGSRKRDEQTPTGMKEENSG